MNSVSPSCLIEKSLLFYVKASLGYWAAKIARNAQRDRESITALEALGWDVLVIWECELREPELLNRKITTFLRQG